MPVVEVFTPELFSELMKQMKVASGFFVSLCRSGYFLGINFLKFKGVDIPNMSILERRYILTKTIIFSIYLKLASV